VGAYSAAVLADAPVYYWRMNDGWGKLCVDSAGTWDVTGGSETLLAQQGPNVDGGSAYTFQSINFSSSSVRAIPAVVTLEAWVWPTIQDGVSHDFLAWDDVTAGGIVLLQNAANKFQFFARSTSVTDPTVQTLQHWHHVVGTADAANLKMYVDGALTATVASGAATTPSLKISLGMRANATATYPGFLSEVAIYNYALSAARVTAHFNAADQKTGSPAFRGFSPVNQSGVIQNLALESDLLTVLASVRKTYVAP